MNIKIDNDYIESCVYRLNYKDNQPRLASDVIIGSYTSDLTLAADWSNMIEAEQVAAAIKGSLVIDTIC